jgi:hypothetical protein
MIRFRVLRPKTLGQTFEKKVRPYKALGKLHAKNCLGSGIMNHEGFQFIMKNKCSSFNVMVANFCKNVRPKSPSY